MKLSPQNVFLVICILPSIRGHLTGKHPNVLFLIVDDLRPTLGCYGDDIAITPNIDGLARSGVIFSRAYAQQALCGPSRTSFLTSRRPDTTKVYDNVGQYWREWSGNFTTMPQYFKEHGYHTVSVGKIFHPGRLSNKSDDSPYSWSEKPYHPSTQKHKQDPVCLGPDGKTYTNIYCPVTVADMAEESLPDLQTTAFATQWVENRATSKEKDKPFFLAVGYHKPHIPLKFPKEFLDLYRISSIPLAPNRHLPPLMPSVAWNPWNDLRSRDDIGSLNLSFPFGPMPDDYARYIRQGYYAATSYTDSLIGKLVEVVKKNFPDTLVAFIGDHGWALGEHQEWSKFSNYEVTTRVPFILTHLSWDYPRSHSQQQQSPQSQLFSMKLDISDLNDPPVFHPNDQQYTPLPKTHPHQMVDHQDLGGDVQNVFEDLDQKSPSITRGQLLNNPNRDTEGHESQNSLNTMVNHESPMVIDHSQYKISRIPESMSIYEKQRIRNMNVKNSESIITAVSDIVELLDLFPTLVELAGLPTLQKCPRNSSQILVCTEGRSVATIYRVAMTEQLVHPVHNLNKPQLFAQPPVDEWTTTSGKLLTKPDKNHFNSVLDQVAYRAFIKSKPKADTKPAFSQYPRPGLYPTHHPDSDQPHLNQMKVMGYSVRTPDFRYTAWVAFNASSIQPDFEKLYAEELYDHTSDEEENYNVANEAIYRKKKKRLFQLVREGWHGEQEEKQVAR